MLPVTYLFPDAVKALIGEYNINNRMGTFLYKNEDIHQWFRQKYLKSEHSDYVYDRFVFVDRCNQIERELLLLIRDQFNGREVVTTDAFAKREVKGKIQINLTRTYTSGGDEHITEDHMAMRGVRNGNALDEQTIAFWVVTDDRSTTHLYTADQVTLEYPTDAEHDILMERYEVAAETAQQEHWEATH